MANLVSKKKILFVIPSLEGGGSEKVLSVLLNYISSNRYDVELAVICKTGHYYDKLPGSIKKTNLQSSRNRYSAIKIYKYIKQASPDLVMTFNVNHTILNVFIASIFLGSRIKYIARESTILSIVVGRKKWGFILKFLYKLAYRKLDLVVSQSSYMKKDLIEHFQIPERKAVIINNPLEVDMIANRAIGGGTLFVQGRFNILAVGRLVPVKGFDLLIDALSKVNDPRIHLTIIGGETPEAPMYKDLLLKLIGQHGLERRVDILPFNANPYGYMLQADMQVISSRVEGFPNVAIEANSLGKPVIAFQSPGGITDIIIQNVNGLLVENGNTAALAFALEEGSKREWNSVEISKTAKKYDISIIVPEYEKVFDNLLSK